MPTKPSDLLDKILSVTELLEKPPIRALADRWNRSVVAAGVRSFLDELRADVARRAAEMQLPSVRELAERAARHVVALQQHSQRPAINATGRILGPPWVSTPLSDAALERFVALGRDFVVGPESRKSDGSTATDVAELLCRATQAQAATAVHSYAGAVWLALSALARDQEVIVSRAEMGDVDAGRPLSKLAASAGAHLKEVGATNRLRAADYEWAISQRSAALLKVHADDYCIVGDTSWPELEELVGLARDRELLLIDALGSAPLGNLPPELDLKRRSARDSIAAGADVVILRGDGLLGGPSCGIILAGRELLARIVEHPLFTAWQLDVLRAAALSATLECHSETSPSAAGAPVAQLLSTPLDNLRDRAERLAPQLSQAEGIADAQPIATCSRLSSAVAPADGLPSYGVALKAVDGNIQALEKQFATTRPPVVGRIEQDRLILDLRTVFPRQDQLLVEAIGGRNPADSPE